MESVHQQQPRRIAIVGTTGAGKTTLARAAAEALGFPHIELDALYWAPHWTPEPTEAFRQRVDAATAQSAWVCDGNYHAVRDVVWDRADTVVWLDLPFRVHLWRILSRGLRRSVRRELLWGTNRETLRSNFLSRNALLWWLFKTYGRRKQEVPQVLALPKYRHLQTVHLTSVQAAERWLTSIAPRPVV